MNRRMLTAASALLLLAGCTSLRACKVRDAALPDAQDVHADAPSLLPAMPVASTSANRGQKPEGPATTIVPATATMLPAPDGQVAVRIRAHVNNAPILDQELREAMVMRAGELMSVPEMQRATHIQEVANRELDRLVERELILQDAMQRIQEMKRPQLLEKLREEAGKEADRRLKEIKTASKIADDAAFRSFMTQQGLSVEGLRRQFERNFMVTEYMRNLVFPAVQRISLQQVREYYEEHPEEFVRADRVKWLDIFIEASRFPTGDALRQHADLILERAKAGEDFRALAKQFDHGDSSLRNGDGLGQKRGEIRPAQAEQVVFSLRPNEVGPIVDVGFGLHIIKVVERDYAGPEPFDEKCQAKVRDKLRGLIAEREYKRIVDDLKRNATVVIYP